MTKRNWSARWRWFNALTADEREDFFNWFYAWTGINL